MSLNRNPILSYLGPPARGAFMMDLDGKCDELVKGYLDCLKQAMENKEKDSNQKCRLIASEYLKCRMENGLMENEPVENLGYKFKT